MNKHFKLTNKIITNDFGIELRQIQATRDSKYAKKGDLGGYVESLENLEDNAWVGGKAQVWGKAVVSGNAKVWDNAKVCGEVYIYHNAKIYDNAMLRDNAWITDNAKVCGKAQVFGHAKISGNAWVGGNAHVCGLAEVSGEAKVFGNAHITNNAKVLGKAHITNDIIICNKALIESNDDYCNFDNFGSVNRSTTAFKCEDGSIRVKCGRFEGTLKEFEEKVIKDGDNKYAKQYLAMIQMMKLKFEKNI